jgi:flavorubredoxin
MNPRKIRDGISWVGALDWDRRLFDSLVPLPDGTSYNAYLVEGSEKTALLDTVDIPMVGVLMQRLRSLKELHYIVAHHAEQDHSGSIPQMLQAFPAARVVCTPKCKDMLIDHLALAPEVFITVDDGATISLGDRTLRFLHTPWVHWPETMSTYIPEERILFSCDFFGSHLAASDLFVRDTGVVYEAAKRYYSEIMMPFAKFIQKNIAKVAPLPLDIIAPSHGPVYDDPKFILDAYKAWSSDVSKNEVLFPYVSMHGSTKAMVDYLAGALAERGVTVYMFDMAVSDIGKVAMALLDATTMILGTPTVNGGSHPNVAYAAMLVNSLRPKLKYLSVIGSYGWSSKVTEQLVGAMPNLKVEMLPPVLCKGVPRAEEFAALDALADAIAEKHAGL